MGARRLGLFWGRGLLAVVVLAVAVGGLTWALVRAVAAPGATFADLGAIVAGLATGTLALGAGWLVLVALLAARHVATGRRLLVGAQCVAALAAAAVVGFGGLALIGGLDEHSGPAVVLVLVAAVAAPPLLVRRAAR